MRRPLTSQTLLIASHNQGKIKEMRDLFTPYQLEIKDARVLGLVEPAETGTNFIANAELKARAAAEASGLVSLADDSGLAVDVLDGAPGIYSARWALVEKTAKAGQAVTTEKDFMHAMEKVHKAVQKALQKAEAETGQTGQTSATHNVHKPPIAHFICALTLAWPDGHCESFEGRVSGHLTWPPRGTKGFGYDPIFIPQGSHLTFAEIEPAQKHAQSHRADAFRQLVAACLPHPDRAAND